MAWKEGKIARELEKWEYVTLLTKGEGGDDPWVAQQLSACLRPGV